MTQDRGSAQIPERTGALRGLRIIDFGHYIAGPLAGMLLADQGAEVIKVEKPQGDPAPIHPAFATWNRGKQSVVIDLYTPVRCNIERLLSLGGVMHSGTRITRGRKRTTTSG